jgi:hypothetical protein
VPGKVCYRLSTQKIIPDMSKGSTQKVSTQLVWARENDVIPWEWIVDETRSAEQVSTWRDEQSFVNSIKRSYRKDLWHDQPYEVEVWSEKGTVRGTLWPVLSELGVSFRVFHGFTSATAVYEVSDYSWNYKHIKALYVGDYDPSGMSMSESDLPNRIEKYRGNIEIKRVALTYYDTDGLPSFSVEEKKKDTRYSWFKENYGNRCWELDAMNPVDLRKRVDTEIRDLIDWAEWTRSAKTEAAEIESINTVLANWQASISGQVRK